MKWKFQAGDFVSTPGIGANGTIYLCSRDGFLYALEPDGSLIWQSLVGFIDGSPSIGSDGVIYVGTSGYLYAINPNSILKWKIQTGTYTSSSPAIGPHGEIYIGTGIHSLAAIGETPTLNPQIQFGLHIDPEKESFKNGDSFELKFDVQTPSNATSADIYFVMLDPANYLYFVINWGLTPVALLESFSLQENLKISGEKLMKITIPSQKPPINRSGTHVFAIGASKSGTNNFVSNIATASFKVE